jgi:hypothetical protein
MDDNSSGKTSLRKGDYYLRRFFGDDPSFMFLIFEELDTTTLHLQIQQDTEKHVLHTDCQQQPSKGISRNGCQPRRKPVLG